MIRPVVLAGAFCAAMLGSQVAAQTAPETVLTEHLDGIVTVRGVHYVNRTLTVETADGERIRVGVPPGAPNLYQIQPGAKFRIRYVQAVAVGLLEPGALPGAGSGEATKFAPAGDTPGGIVVRVAQLSGKIVDIDHAARKVLVRGPHGKLREFIVSDTVEGFGLLEVGDVIGLQVTEALALEMIAR